MKKFLIISVLMMFCGMGSQMPAQAGVWHTHKAKISQEVNNDTAVKEIKKLFEKQDKLTNSYNYEELYKIYSEDFVNGDGYDKKVYFKQIKETWETYPDITYKTEVKNISVTSQYATVETSETAFAVAEEKDSEISAVGELHSTARCIYHLRRDPSGWVITSEDVLEERSSLKFGDARFIKMELNSPSLVPAGGEYAAELKVDMPEDQVVIASISQENITPSVERNAEKYKQLPLNQEIERIFHANRDNVNEYNIASVGVTKTEPLDEENVKVYMSGLAFLMTRVNVISKNNFVKLEDKEIGKAE